MSRVQLRVATAGTAAYESELGIDSTEVAILNVLSPVCDVWTTYRWL